jgi:hypothetical protein
MTISPGILDSGERLVWSGKPNPMGYAIYKGRWMFLIGIPFFAFSIFWISMAATGGGKAAQPFPFWLFGVPFIVIGAGLVLSPLWYFVRGTGTTYALTSKRAITDITGMFPLRTSIPLDQIRFVDLRQSASGAGDVLFHETTSSYGNNQSTRRDGFIAIPDARRVDQLLRSAMEKASSARGGTA